MDILEKGKLIGKTFMAGAKVPLDKEWVWGTAAVVGLSQGLKYKGNIKTGLAGGLATMAVISGVTGVLNVIHNWEDLKLILQGD